MDDLKQRIDAAQRETTRRAESHPNAQPLIPELQTEATHDPEGPLAEEMLAEFLDDRLSAIRSALEGKNPDVNVDKVFEGALITLGAWIASTQDGLITSHGGSACKLFTTLKALSRKFPLSADNEDRIQEFVRLMNSRSVTWTNVVTRALRYSGDLIATEPLSFANISTVYDEYPAIRDVFGPEDGSSQHRDAMASLESRIFDAHTISKYLEDARQRLYLELRPEGAIRDYAKFLLLMRERQLSAIQESHHRELVEALAAPQIVEEAIATMLDDLKDIRSSNRIATQEVLCSYIAMEELISLLRERAEKLRAERSRRQSQDSLTEGKGNGHPPHPPMTRF